MIIKIGDTTVSVTEVLGLRNYRGDRVLGLSCTTGNKGWIKLLKDMSLQEFYDYIEGKTSCSVCSIQKREVMKILGLTRGILRTIINTPARAKEFLFLHECSHILHHDSGDDRLNRSDHLSLYRIGIEARATWEAWIKMKHKYMGTFRVKSKLFGAVDTALSMSAGNKDLESANKALTEAKSARGAATGDLKTAFTNWQGQEGNAGKKMSEFVKTEEGAAKLKGLQEANKNIGTQVNTIKDTVGRGKFIGQAAMDAGVKDMSKVSNAAFNAGKNSAGFGTAISNTWKTNGGKAALIAGGAGLLGMGAMAAKGMMGGGQKEFSGDIDKDTREAIIIGTGLALAGGGTLAAKKGYLGFTKGQRKASQEAYNKAIGKVKAVFKEKKGDSSAAVEKATEATKKKRYPEDQWKKMNEWLRKPENKDKKPADAAKALGFDK